MGRDQFITLRERAEAVVASELCGNRREGLACTTCDAQQLAYREATTPQAILSLLDAAEGRDDMKPSESYAQGYQDAMREAEQVARARCVYYCAKRAAYDADCQVCQLADLYHRRSRREGEE